MRLLKALWVHIPVKEEYFNVHFLCMKTEQCNSPSSNNNLILCMTYFEFKLKIYFYTDSPRLTTEIRSYTAS